MDVKIAPLFAELRLKKKEYRLDQEPAAEENCLHYSILKHFFANSWDCKQIAATPCNLVPPNRTCLGGSVGAWST